MSDMLAPGKWSLVDARLGPTPRRGHSICVARVQGEESALLFGGMQAGTQTAGLHPSTAELHFSARQRICFSNYIIYVACI